MSENIFVKESFNQLTTKGYLGDPEGILAYSYIRVSSAQQAEDGRSGLPRQLQHCHEVAMQHHLKISWEMVFADDGFSGFEFETRPALSRLREELKTGPRSRHVVIEHLDRLSRNARWHQGFLLDEFTRYHVTPVFWKSFSSEIERAVLGTISEEGMRAEIARMMEGMRLKAVSGRVTAKRPRFGYMFVDSEGKASDKARQDTHYAIHPEQSKIVRWIFNCVICERKSLHLIAQAMNDQKIPTMFTGKLWCTGTIARIVSDPVYKGEFYARRWYCERNGKVNAQGRPQGIMRQRPPEEWIRVDVPAIISPADWKLAQENLKANQKRSTRNMTKREWLLSSFVKCDICHYSYISERGGSQKQGYPLRYYACKGRQNERARLSNHFCLSPGVRADKLESFVWGKIEEVVAHPELVDQLLYDTSEDRQILTLEEELDFIDRQLSEVQEIHDRWKRAYEAKVICLEEYDAYRAECRRKEVELKKAKGELSGKCESKMSLPEKKRLIRQGLAEIGQALLPPESEGEVPFERKRRILKQMLDHIWVNSEEKKIRFEGVLKSSYGPEATQYVFGSDLKWRLCERCWST